GVGQCHTATFESRQNTTNKGTEVRMRSNLMRHFIQVTAMLALTLSGHAQNASSQSTTNPQVVEGKGMYWSIDDVKKALSAGTPVRLPRTSRYLMTVKNRLK